MSCVLSTDNRLVSSTTLSRELELATTHFSIDRERLRRLVMSGFKKSFFPGSYAEKREYFERIGKYYDRVASEFAE